jgi:hypothetical protein
MVVVGGFNRTTRVGNSRGCIFTVGILVGDFLSCDAGGIGGYINLKENQNPIVNEGQ